MKGKLTYILKAVSFKHWLLFFTSSQAIYLFMRFYSIPRVSKEAEGLPIFDMQPLGYTPAYADQFLERLSDTGYQLYMYLQLPLDFLFPILNCFTAIATFLLLVRIHNKLKLRPAISIHQMLPKLICFLPLIAMSADYLENIMIYMLLSYKTAIPQDFVYLASSFTITKSVITSIFYVILLVVFIWGCAGWLKKKGNKEKINEKLRN